MVRIGTLPMRLLALDYGADIVYTEELIDWKLLRSFRRVNDVLGTVDYIDKTDGTVTFRTCLRERNKVVLQIGTCDAARALKVAKMVEQDVAGIDLNMGCPKLFSMLGKMGAALLQEPEMATKILKTLVDNLSIPVTCKIRILQDVEKTLELCELLASTGISAIAVHGRTVNERPQHANRNEVLKAISSKLLIPVIANGGSKDVQKYSDISKFKEVTGCSSVMLARAAQWNCSIFCKDGLLPMEDVIKAYIKIAVDCDNSPSNTKYCIQNILLEQQESALGKRFLNSQTLEQICAVWELSDYCCSKRKEFEEKGLQGRSQVSPMKEDEVQNEDQVSNKRKFSGEEDVVLMHCAFLRNNYLTDLELPFRSVVTVDGRKFGSSFWEKNKKWAEQGAALVCLYSLGLLSEKALVTTGNVIS
ncbi:tRNA-dihydrouridine(20) synthase [NAD(P)+]-like [Dufourea novaeangliae]|uniref:tRNA-dihydrouridine(20) synthase [NAD(P)+]-like n=2 Tax=Dufourea novaeangliae TaxID=178035 RepID=A0A154P0K6_DUFNO|nr:tRNA-dihydrouridine(20) synthase [NAD(P)+]-like [Dufourea novaeangliae]